MDLPDWFFRRDDESPDSRFYEPPRLVVHLDDRARRAVGELYAELDVSGRVLDLMSSWVSHFLRPPRDLTVLGLNAEELARNPIAHERVVHDLNADPTLPFADGAFDAVTCCVSVDYLVRPIEVCAELARVLRPAGVCVFTFSNRCFPDKAIAGWLASDDEQRCRIVAEYLRAAGGFRPARAELRTPAGTPGDPLYGVWAARSGYGILAG